VQHWPPNSRISNVILLVRRVINLQTIEIHLIGLLIFGVQIVIFKKIVGAAE